MFLEPTEMQKLRLQLAQRNCDLNIAKRCHMESEIRFYQFILSVVQANLSLAEAENARLQAESEQLKHEFFNAGEQIKTENGWGDHVRWDATTLKYTALANNGWPTVSDKVGEDKIRIQ